MQWWISFFQTVGIEVKQCALVLFVCFLRKGFILIVQKCVWLWWLQAVHDVTAAWPRHIWADPRQVATGSPGKMCRHECAHWRYQGTCGLHGWWVLVLFFNSWQLRWDKARYKAFRVFTTRWLKKFLRTLVWHCCLHCFMLWPLLPYTHLSKTDFPVCLWIWSVRTHNYNLMAGWEMLEMYVQNAELLPFSCYTC